MPQLLITLVPKWHAVAVSMLLLGCTENKTFKSFDNTSWKSDKLACKGERKALADDFEQIRRELLGQSQESIIELLGRPDFQLLYERSQKVYVYFIEPGTQCTGDKEAAKSRTIYFRFNALNRATEVMYSQGKPS